MFFNQLNKFQTRPRYNLDKSSDHHDDGTINVASIEKNASLTGIHVVQPTRTIFELEKCPALCGKVFQATGTLLELIQYIIGTNVLTTFHDYQSINVASSEFTKQMLTLFAGQKIIMKAQNEHVKLK
ncbi:hypothetical protein DPMN_139217 [Dreissena polymorpha]|uniref:Uncharacterized protein n=1 Tax=Dreissena polymorpha TaxID=45954 RepID=A0A9D4G5B3_DREPO|nr:hypothetical protein DPMN_139217 [Dreissena polymorpha]